jgi:hypothetical protein
VDEERAPGPVHGDGLGVRSGLQLRIDERAVLARHDVGKQFNRLSGQWENYGNKNDWNTMCGTCHTTGYRILEVDKASGATLKASWSELSVGCEACHGPGASHTFNKEPRPSGKGAADMGPPQYYE